MTGEPRGESFFKDYRKERQVQGVPYIVAEKPIAGERRLKVRSVNTGSEYVIEVEHPERFAPGEKIYYRASGMKRVGRDEYIHIGSIAGQYAKEIEHSRLEVGEDDVIPAEPVEGAGAEVARREEEAAERLDENTNGTSRETETVGEATVSAERRRERMTGMVVEYPDGTRQLSVNDTTTLSEEEVPGIKGMFIADGAILGFERSSEGGWDLIENLGQATEPETNAAIRVFLEGGAEERVASEISPKKEAPTLTEITDTSVDTMDAGVDAEPRLKEEQPLPPDEEQKTFHPVGYEGRRAFAQIGTARYRITNADEYMLLPGDTVQVIASGEYQADIMEVKYAGRSVKVGRFEYEAEDARNTRTTGKRRLNFVVRVPQEDGTTEKVRFPIELVRGDKSDEEIQRFEREKLYIFFNRDEGKIVGTPVSGTELSFYDVALINLGIKQPGGATEDLQRAEKEQLDALIASYGAKRSMRRDAVIHASALEMRKRIKHEVQQGQREDFRDGERVVIAVDTAEAKKRDDAFSVGPSSRGEGWYEIGIHIVDPRALIPAGSALDRGAAERTARLNLPGDVWPMMPEVLAALGSLEPRQDRRAFALIFDAKLTESGGVEIRGIRFAPTALQVERAYSYDGANALLQGTTGTAQHQHAWKIFSSVMNEINQRGVIYKNAKTVPSPLDDADDVVAIANIAFNRAGAEAFGRIKRKSFPPRLKRLSDMAHGTYRNLLKHRSGQSMLEQSTTPRGNVRYGGQYAYLSAPLRDYSSIVGLRALAFLADLQKRSESGKDISAQTARKLAERYARDVAGIPLSEETLSLPGDKLVKAVRKQTEAHTNSVLEHALNREELITRTERVMRNMRTLEKISATIRKDGPVSIPSGIQVELTDMGRENGKELAYGYARSTKRINQFFRENKFVPAQAQQLRFAVKFPLPEEMVAPNVPGEMYLGGSIVDVDVEKGRLILDVEEDYGTPPPPPPPIRRGR